VAIDLSNLSAEWVRWGISAAIFVFFILLAFASKFIITKIIHMLTHRTKTILDDLLVKALAWPFIVVLITAGLWIALARLPELDKYLSTIHQIFIIIYICLATVAIIRVAHALLTWYGTEVAARTKTDIDDHLIPILKRVGDAVIYIIALMIILDQLGVPINTLLASIGIGGLAVALALQPTLSSFVAGTYIMTDAAIRKGDYIMLESGQEGTVEDIGWRSTKIRHWQGNLIILPNSKLAESIVTDFDKPEAAMQFSIDCGVSYDSDLEKVERIATDVARKLLDNHPSGVEGFEPIVRFKQFGDSNINFSVVLKGKDRSAQFILKHEFIKELSKRFQKEGIEIQYPARKLFFANDMPPQLHD
jgi:small-conductance mechanosensitive channel